MARSYDDYGFPGGLNSGLASPFGGGMQNPIASPFRVGTPTPSAGSAPAKTLGAALGAAKPGYKGSKAGAAAPADGGQLSLEDILAMMAGSSGSGGGGRGAAIAGLLADVDTREQRARDRYAQNTADVTTMYGQLSSAISGYRPTIETDYASQIASTNERATEQSGLLSNELAAQQGRRAAGAADLGITGQQLAGGPELQSEAVLNEALGTIGNTATNWTGFLNAERGNTLDRNENSATAATATGAGANDQLRMALEGYIQNLDSERAQIKASGSGGGGGGGGGGGSSAQNGVLSYLAKALIDQQMQGPSEFEQKLGALGQLGLNPGSIGTALGNISRNNGQGASANDYWTQLIAKSLFD